MQVFKIFFRPLLLLTLLFVLLACARKAPSLGFVNEPLDTNCFAKLTEIEEKQLYNTKVDVLNKHLSGLLFIKNFADGSTRTVFSNEMGIKFFDFQFKGDKDSTLYCMPKLNRKQVIRILKKDLRQAFFLINEQQGKSIKTDSLRYFTFIQNPKETIQYTALPDCSIMTSALHVKEGKQLVKINYSGLKQDSIAIKHLTFDMTITLKKIIQEKEIQADSTTGE